MEAHMKRKEPEERLMIMRRRRKGGGMFDWLDFFSLIACSVVVADDDWGKEIAKYFSRKKEVSFGVTEWAHSLMIIMTWTRVYQFSSRSPLAIYSVQMREKRDDDAGEEEKKRREQSYCLYVRCLSRMMMRTKGGEIFFFSSWWWLCLLLLKQRLLLLRWMSRKKCRYCYWLLCFFAGVTCREKKVLDYQFSLHSSVLCWERNVVKLNHLLFADEKVDRHSK